MQMRWPLALGVLASLMACQTEVSFKAVTFETGDRDVVYDATKRVIASHFYGVPITEEKEAGRLTTGFLQMGAEPMLREQVLALVTSLGETTKVEILALVEEGQADIESFGGVTWTARGSDLRVEQQLLREIIEQVAAAGFTGRASSDEEIEP